MIDKPDPKAGLQPAQHGQAFLAWLGLLCTSEVEEEQADLQHDEGPRARLPAPRYP